jgi:hypothetical protein
MFASNRLNAGSHHGYDSTSVSGRWPLAHFSRPVKGEPTNAVVQAFATVQPSPEGGSHDRAKRRAEATG